MPNSARSSGTGIRYSRPILYYITDRKQLSGVSLPTAVRRVLVGGVDFIQVREKDLSDVESYLLTRRIVALARESSCRVLVNGRADIALAAGADGVHLPSSGVRAKDLRSWVPSQFLIGVSTHSVGEAARAEADGADYVLLGPVFETPSKVRYGDPLGLTPLKRACRRLSIPVLALGGLSPENLQVVREAGAAGFAGISLFQKYSLFWK